MDKRKIYGIQKYDTLRGLWYFKIYTLSSLFSCCQQLQNYEYELYSDEFQCGWTETQYKFLDKIYQDDGKSYIIHWNKEKNKNDIDFQTFGYLHVIKINELDM